MQNVKKKNKKNSKKCYHPENFKHIVCVRNTRGRLAQLSEHPAQRRKACEAKDAKADLASNRGL